MRIQHNIMAMNSYRNYNNNANALGKNLEKLSSGYRVNRAGDDAAGLAISEKMRAQITGLDAAQKNVQDGISLVKTAEGAMQEIQDMLNRMKYLAVQSANGTYDNEVDRMNLQKEVTALKNEIDRIADSANFNGMKLLDGSLEAPSGAILVKTGFNNAALATQTASGGATFSQTLTITSTATAVNGGKLGSEGKMEIAFLDKEGTGRNATITFTYGASASATASNMVAAIKDVFGSDYNVTATGAAITIKNANGNEKDLTKILNATQYNEKGEKITSTTNKPTVGTAAEGKDDVFGMNMSSITTATAKNVFEVDGQKFQVVQRGSTADAGYIAIYTDDGLVKTEDQVEQVVDQLNAYGVKAEKSTTAPTTTVNLIKSNGNDGNGGLTLQIGDTAHQYNQMKVGVHDMHVQALGIASLDISTLSGAQAAVDMITDAINLVSSTRGDLGAIQNRLEHTANNLSVMEENIQNAESAIRDTDIADEMTAYTKNNILLQSAQAMLAQANQVPQGVLQLLQ